MDSKVLVELVGHIAWPLTIAVVVIVFRKQIRDLIHDISNIKIGDVTVALEHLTEKVDSVEMATRNLSVDLYRVTGDALKVREEIWSYIADILRRASPETRYEMAAELNKYHLSRLGVKASDVKSMLNLLGYFGAQGASGFDEDISRDFVQSVFDFQDAQQLEYSDGILGPSTLAILKQNLAGRKSTQQEDPADA